MNHKSQIAIIMLFPLAIILSLAALFAMASFNNNLDSQSKNLSEMMSNVKFNEIYVRQQAHLIFNESLSSCNGCSLEQIKEKVIVVAAERETIHLYEGAGNLYAKLRNPAQFQVEKNENEYLLKIGDLFVQSQKGQNRIQRDFNVTIQITS